MLGAVVSDACGQQVAVAWNNNAGGNWSVAVLNSDGSRPVVVNASAGLKLAFLTPPPFHLKNGAPLGAIKVQLTDAQGVPFMPARPLTVHASATGGTLTSDSGTDAKLTTGPVTFENSTLTSGVAALAAPVPISRIRPATIRFIFVS